jgi:hypothetical protein
VQIDDQSAAGALMQTIDVLRNDTFDASRLFQCGQREVRAARKHTAELAPSGRTPGPITLPRSQTADKFLIRHGRLAFPGAFPIAVVREP